MMRTIICVGTPSIASAMAASILRDEGWVVHTTEEGLMERMPPWSARYDMLEDTFDTHWRLGHYTELRTKAVNRNLRPRVRRYRVKREVNIDDINCTLYMRSRYGMHKRVIAYRIACQVIMSDAIDTLPYSREWAHGHGRDTPWWMSE
jgi:hypothetical protein